MAKFGQKTTFVEKNFLTIFWEISSRENPESLNMITLTPKKLWACAVFGRQVVTASYLAPHGIVGILLIPLIGDTVNYRVSVALKSLVMSVMAE